MSRAEARFSYGPREAGLVRYGLPLEFALGVGFVVIAGLAGYALKGVYGIGGALVGLYVAWLILSRAWMRAKHLSVLRAEYLVREDGVAVILNGAPAMTTWAEMEKAEYLPGIPAYRMWRLGESSPIVIFLDSRWLRGKADARRNSVAKRLVESGMSGRLIRRWIP